MKIAMGLIIPTNDRLCPQRSEAAGVESRGLFRWAIRPWDALVELRRPDSNGRFLVYETSEMTASPRRRDRAYPTRPK